MEKEIKGAGYTGKMTKHWSRGKVLPVLLTFILLLTLFPSAQADDKDVLKKCSCTGQCHGRELTQQAVSRNKSWFAGGGSNECCQICKEIWGQTCGGYADCHKEDSCWECCQNWCSFLTDTGAEKNCDSTCISNCKNYVNVWEILDAISLVAVIIAGIMIAIHGISLITSFGPYERSSAKTAVKYAIIVLLLLGIAGNVIGFLFHPFRVPGGVNTEPVCVACANVNSCSDYSLGKCSQNPCNIHFTCYGSSSGSCLTCSEDPPGSCSDYAQPSCEADPCDLDKSCVVDTMTGNCIQASAATGGLVCGEAAGDYTNEEASFIGGLCDGGSAASTPSFPAKGESVQWNCTDTDGNVLDTCVARHLNCSESGYTCQADECDSGAVSCDSKGTCESGDYCCDCPDVCMMPEPANATVEDV